VANNGKKVAPWWNQEVKDTFRAKSAAYRICLQNKAELSLHSRHTEANEYAAQMEKRQKCSENCGHRLDSNYWQVIWQTIWRFHGKESHVARSIEDKNGISLSNEGS